MASALQKVTRIAPFAMLAPPVRAARAPSIARETNDVAATTIDRIDEGLMRAIVSGSAEPTANVAADVSAA